MKMRRSIIWIAAILSALVAAMLLNGKKQLAEKPLVSSEGNVASSVAAEPIPPTSEPLPSSLPSAPVASNAGAGTNQPKSPVMNDKVALIQQALNANDATIVFYGRLEDQFNNAVGGADVNFNVQYENARDRGIKQGHVVSDGNGFFTISGYTGANLTITPRKTGYALATTGTSFRYSQISSGYFVPDAINPAVIKMWKLHGAEPLVSIDKTYKLKYTGAPIHFDLIAGQSVPSGGDLTIGVNRPVGVISGHNPQDWSIDVEVADGGFIESSPGESATTYAAPESGYQPSGRFGKNNGPDLVDKMFFMQSRNGQVYSKIHLLFGINDTPDGFMYITFNGVANTNTSRNWEASAPQ
jgi:hypothetical protein